MALSGIVGCLALLFAGPIAHPAAAPLADDPVGFIWHYPFVDVGTPEIARSGANVMAARANWGALQPEPGRFDFNGIDRQLSEARRGGYRLMLILECSPVCAPRWVVDAAASAGDLVRDPLNRASGQGPHGGVPRAHSARFRDLQRRFLRACIGHIRAADPQHTITRYFPGIEWWFPPSFRYAEADQARFRQWLRSRHRDLAALNRAWGTAFGGWPAVVPPRIDVADLFTKGRTGLAPFVPVAPSPTNASGAANDDWEAFWTASAADAINNLAADVRGLDPTRRTVSFLTFAFAGPAEWDYTRWAAVSVDAVARTGAAVDDLGMQLVAADGDPYRIVAGLDLARKYGKPPMVLDLLDFARGVRIGPDAMRRATLAAVQHGARGLIYCCWNGAKDFNFHPDWPMEDLRAMLAEARAALRLTDAMKPHVRAAMVMPRVIAAPGGANPEQNSPLSAMGWHRMLESADLTVDCLTPDDLARRLADPARYAAILVPDCAWLPRAAAAGLARYAAHGGRLVSGGRTPLRAPDGGALAIHIPWAARLPDYGAALAGNPVRDNTAGDTPPMFIWGPDTADRAHTRRAAIAALDRALPPAYAARPIRINGAHSGVSAVLFTGASGSAVFLTRSAPAPARRLTVTIAGAATARRVEALPDLAPATCAVRRIAGNLSVTLPPFQRAAVVRLPGWRPPR